MDAESLKQHYVEGAASQYEAGRRDNPKWRVEQATVEALLDPLPSGSRIADVPVGTGRFLEYYSNRGFAVLGVDSSRDMLREAEARSCSGQFVLQLQQGDIRSLEIGDRGVDVSVCIRFMNLVPADFMAAAMKELARVSDRGVVVGIRHLTPFSRMVPPVFSGLRRVAHQYFSRFMHSRQGKIVLHRHAQVEEAIRSAGLQVAEAHRIESRRDGTDYIIYWLTR